MVKLTDERLHQTRIKFSKIGGFSRVAEGDGLDASSANHQPLQPLLKPFEADELPKNSLVFDD